MMDHHTEGTGERKSERESERTLHKEQVGRTGIKSVCIHTLHDE